MGQVWGGSYHMGQVWGEVTPGGYTWWLHMVVTSGAETDAIWGKCVGENCHMGQVCGWELPYGASVRVRRPRAPSTEPLTAHLVRELDHLGEPKLGLLVVTRQLVRGEELLDLAVVDARMHDDAESPLGPEQEVLVHRVQRAELSEHGASEALAPCRCIEQLAVAQ